MPIELRTQRDGRYRSNWYGRYEIGGRRYYVNLGIKVAGTPPASLSIKHEGDAAFERSRAAAQAKLDALIEESQSPRDSARLVQKLYEIKTGERIRSIPLDKLAEEWVRIPRRRQPNARYAQQSQSTLRRFAAFVRQANPKAKEIADVTRQTARAFMDAETQRGVTAKTWNDILKLLRATFKYLLPAGAINPFSDTPTRETSTMFRVPFSPEELKAIVDAAQSDPFIRPILVTGICTAMRRGDCCLLKWKDVDLDRRFITVKTAKTGQTISIPIFPMLHDELASLRSARKPPGSPSTEAESGFVFPEQARMYQENPDGITWRVKKVFADALKPTSEASPSNPALEDVSPDELQRQAAAYLAKLPDSTKKAKMAAVVNLYISGKRLCDVVTATGVSKGGVSGYLNQIEREIGCQLIRGRRGKRGVAARLKAPDDLLSAKRDDGQRRASIRDFHSLRVTWVTLALTAGVPLELVQKVTGHKTTDIVLKHYFQPGREAFRQALHAAMPKLLTNGQKSPKEEMREIIEHTTRETWIVDKARLAQLLEKV